MPIDVYPTPDWGPNHSDNPDFTPYEDEEEIEVEDDDNDDSEVEDFFTEELG